MNARSRIMKRASTRHIIGTDIPLPTGPSTTRRFKGVWHRVPEFKGLRARTVDALLDA